MIAFTVLGTPAPKGSYRAMTNRKTGRAFSFAGGSPITAARLRAWDTAVREAANECAGDLLQGPMLIAKPLTVTILFKLARPGGHWHPKGHLRPKVVDTWPMSKPDLDKLVRTTLDAMTGVIFDDDSRVVRLVTEKDYALPGREGAQIEVEERRRGWHPPSQT